MSPAIRGDRTSFGITALLAAAGTVAFLLPGADPSRIPLPYLAVAALPPLLLLLLRRRSFRAAILLLAVLLFAGSAAVRSGLLPVPGEGEEEGKRERSVERAREALAVRIDSLALWADRIASDREVATRIRAGDRSRERETLFDLIAGYGARFSSGPEGEGLAVDLYRERDEPALAWWGDVPERGDTDGDGLIRLATDPFRVLLVVESPVRAAGRRTPAGLVRLVCPIGPNPELEGRLERPVPFADRLGREIGGRVLFRPGEGDEGEAIRSPAGTVIGSVRVVFPPAGSRSESFSRLLREGGGLLLLFFWVLFLPWRRAGDGAAAPSDRVSLRGIVRRTPVLSLLALRVILLLFRFPHPFAPRGDLVGPDYFASPLLFGAFRSPADLFLTVAVLFLVCLVLRERAVAAERRQGEGKRSFRPAFFAATLVLLSAATIGFSLLIREILLSCNLTLYDGPNPVGSLPSMVLEVSLLLLGAAYLLLVDAGFARSAGAGALGADRASRLAVAPRILVGVLLGGAVLLFSRLMIRGGEWLLLAPAATLCTGLLLLYLLRGRGWRIWNGLAFVIAVAIVSYPPIRVAQEETTRLGIEERALRFAEPTDEWKRFLLEETLHFFETDPLLAEKLAADPTPDMEREAFLAWVRSGLGLYDYSVEIRILDRQGAVVSQFAMDMPPESAVRSAFVFRDVRAAEKRRIYEGRRRVAGEAVEIYTGAAPLYAEGKLVGAVLIRIPYFYENLEYASKLPATSYEIFRNYSTLERTLVDEGETIQVLLYENGEIARTSGDVYPEETALDSTVVAAMAGGGNVWAPVRIGGREYRAFHTARRDPERGGVLAFALPVADWSDHLRALIHVVLTDLLLAVAVLLVHLPLLAALSLRGGARLRFEPTFQDKLVLAFLLVALLPAILLGLAGRRMVAEQLREAGESEARTALQAVRHALDQDVIREAEEMAQSTLVRRRVLGIREDEEMVDLELSLKRFALFSPEGELILQNGKIGPVNREALREARERRTPVTAFQRADGLAVTAMVGIAMEGLEERLEGILLLSRPIDEEWTARLGERIGRDVSFFEGGAIRASTRYELYQAGILAPRLPAGVFVPLELKGEKMRFADERVAATRYLVGYRSLLDFDGRPVGTLAVPLLFREREARRNLERAYAAITYLTFFTVVVIVGVAEGMGRRIARPIGEMARGMDRIREGDLELTLPVRSGGEIGRLTAAFNRMTRELKRSQDTLTERTRYIETVLGSVGAGVIAFDPEGKVASANRAALQILETEPGEIDGGRLDRVAGGRFAPLQRIVERVRVDRDRPREEEAEIARGEGKMTVRVVATALADEEGRALGKVIVFEDLTALIQSKKLLAWGEMARQVAHEIKNPLTPMKLSVQHLRQAFHDGDARFPDLLDESADLIIEEIDSLQRIATEFSTFARMPRREIRPVPAAAVIGEAVRLYAERLGEGRIEWEVPEDLPVLQVDREEVRRLLINLLENAVHAAGDGGTVRLTAGVADGSPSNDEGWEIWESTVERRLEGRMVEIRVRDDGPGVSDAARGKLFEPNFSTKTDGTGLGLAICRAIAGDYGGSIVIGSTPGRGTAAIVSLPVPPAR
ncbi:MAG: HAMP domain-containing protein [Candidatus Eisenbacteria bacterium]|nr:HAMP domain-containing protein [Candidatus Eisenbacteria bacterium]